MTVKKYFREYLRIIWGIINKFPHRVQCNVCGWRGSKLYSDSWHPHTVCPNCESQVRHRLLFAALKLLPGLGIKDLIQGKNVLHFAPERVITNLLRAESTKYVSADYCRDNVDMQIDMCNMKCIEDGAFDLVMACDVLEHVPDDSAALREIFRILTPNGCVILTVPQKDNLATKYEDPSITTPEGRKIAYGRGDHLRIYGDDFCRFLISHGFSVTVVDERSFNLDIINLHVLFPPVISNHPLATNYRKVYFAQKSPS